MKPTKDEYAMLIAVMAATRSEDPRTKVGAVALTAHGRIIGTAYNGLRASQTLSDDAWNSKEKHLHIIHAEENLMSLLHWWDIHTVVCTLLPCKQCMMIMGLRGVKRVVYLERPPEVTKYTESAEVACQYAVKLEKLNKKLIASLWPEKSIVNQLTDCS